MEKAPGDTREAKHTYPCQHCTDRALGCHGVCKDYLEAKAVDLKRKEMNKATLNPIIREGSFTGDSGFRKRRK